MPSKDNSDSQTAPDADPSPGQTMTRDAATLQDFGFNAMSGMGFVWAEALGDLGSEVLSFVADRIKEDAKTQQRMLHCKDMGELHEIQSEFLQTAINQYTADTGKLVEMSLDMLTPQKAKTDDT